MSFATTSESQVSYIKDYYHFQARFYDATRWAFLFGRKKLIKQFPFDEDAAPDILEVGCGTGSNILDILKRYPFAKVTGRDVSPAMLDKARTKLKNFKGHVWLEEGSFPGEEESEKVYDLIVFTYTLSMVNPGWEKMVHSARELLRDGGYLAVADFHDTRWSSYRKFMKANHVRVEGHLLPFLEKHFSSKVQEKGAGLAGIWRYFNFIGKTN